MNKIRKKELRQVVIEKIKALEQKIKTFGSLSQPVSPDNAIGRLTRMEAISSRSINEAALAKARLTLKALEKTLVSMDNPDFGFCINCEEPIPHKRLMIMPESSLCVSCAQNISSP